MAEQAPTTFADIHEKIFLFGVSFRFLGSTPLFPFSDVSAQIAQIKCVFFPPLILTNVWPIWNWKVNLLGPELPGGYATGHGGRPPHGPGEDLDRLPGPPQVQGPQQQEDGTLHCGYDPPGVSAKKGKNLYILKKVKCFSCIKQCCGTGSGSLVHKETPLNLFNSLYNICIFAP